VRLPFSTRRTHGATVFLQKIEEFKINVKTDDSMFKKPAAQK